jgi:hypothetical protein
MAAKAVCDVCNTETKIETTPMGIALMPQTWFVTVRGEGDALGVIDVCGETCATAFDKSHGRDTTVLRDVAANGTDVADRTIEHKADN